MLTMIRHLVQGFLNPVYIHLDAQKIHRLQERAESLRIPQQRQSPE